MAIQTKTIKSKIKAVGNVKKITKAMEKVAAVKMRKVVASTISAREYAYHTYQLLFSMLQHQNLRHPFFLSGKGGKTLIVAISSNRGLCGNINTQLGRTLSAMIKDKPLGSFEMIAVGKKMERVAQRLNITLTASFTDIPDTVSSRNALVLEKLIVDEYKSGKYEKVLVIYTRYVSALVFEPVIREIFPMSKKEIESTLDRLFKSRASSTKRTFREYLFEPSEEVALNILLPKIIGIKIYKMLLEARASEHSARMMAMKNASENADNLIQDLIISYNQARQDGVTREISEIAGGAEALAH